ncbi:glycosyltransferase [Heyndrickxia coagulans]|uniref:glycosyltransferase n=1 Tax=Heyndrickxia coagulans TaxID=1398 RepID=UPI003D215997
MKKILIVNSFYAPTIVGGAEMYTQTLAESLVNNYDVYVLSTNGHTSGTILREKINGVHVYRLPLHNIYWPGDKEQRNSICKLIWHTKNLYNRKQSVQIKNIIREINPDLVHTQNLMGIGTEIWRIVRKNKIPLVHTIHDYQLITPVTNNFINKVCCLINRKRSKYVDFVTSVSNYTLNEHLKKSFFKKKNIKLYPILLFIKD